MKINYGLMFISMVIILLLAVGVASASENTSDVVKSTNFKEIMTIDDNIENTVSIEEETGSFSTVENNLEVSSLESDNNSVVSYVEENERNNDLLSNNSFEWSALYDKNYTEDNLLVLDLSTIFGENNTGGSVLVFDKNNVDDSYLVIGLSDLSGGKVEYNDSYFVFGLSSILGANTSDDSFLVLNLPDLGINNLGNASLIMDLNNLLSKNSTLEGSFLSIKINDDYAMNISLSEAYENNIFGINLTKLFNGNFTELSSFLSNMDWTYVLDENNTELALKLNDLDWKNIFDGNFSSLEGFFNLSKISDVVSLLNLSSLVDSLNLSSWFNFNVIRYYLIADNVTKYYHGSERFYATLVDRLNQSVANKTILIEINGITYTRTTDENGTVNMALGLSSGVYNAKVNFENKTINSVINILPTVNGTDIVKMFRNGTQYYATFRDSEGNYLANGTTVRFNINGVMYDRKISGDKGLAKLNINLAQGSYIITAMNPVNGENAANNITVLSLFTENKDITKYYKNGTQFTVKVLSEEGNPVGAGKNVTFNINGVFYTRQTNDLGIVKLNINLLQGDYLITSEYMGCKISNTITVLPPLTAKDIAMKILTELSLLQL